MDGLNPGGIALVAGPPSPTPPLSAAIPIVFLSLGAPFLVVRAGAPSPLLAIVVLTLAAAGILTLSSALAARKKLKMDPTIRLRASIRPDGISLHRQPMPQEGQHFKTADIATVMLLGKTLILYTAPTHPDPGRHVLRFGKLATPRPALLAALKAHNKPL